MATIEPYIVQVCKNRPLEPVEKPIQPDKSDVVLPRELGEHATRGVVFINGDRARSSLLAMALP
ncbi:hypothetical protein V1282_001417 [Nitrobacteraceae bacterium AZCC 2146]